MSGRRDRRIPLLREGDTIDRVKILADETGPRTTGKRMPVRCICTTYGHGHDGRECGNTESRTLGTLIYGSTNTSCTRCKAARETAEVPPLGTQWGDWTLKADSNPDVYGNPTQLLVSHKCGTVQAVDKRKWLHNIQHALYEGCSPRVLPLRGRRCCPHWNGSGGGYVQISWGDWKSLEHRYVMDNILWAEYGIRLRPDQTVHHVNGNKADNFPGNLQIRTGKHGNGQVPCCLTCGSEHIGFAPIRDEAA